MCLKNVVDFNTSNAQPKRYHLAPEGRLKGDPGQVTYNRYSSPVPADECRDVGKRSGPV